MKTVVGNERLKNAGSLFSSASSLARIIGPLLAGLVMQVFGPGVCFLVNSISFFVTYTSRSKREERRTEKIITFYQETSFSTTKISCSLSNSKTATVMVRVRQNCTQTLTTCFCPLSQQGFQNLLNLESRTLSLCVLQSAKS